MQIKKQTFSDFVERTDSLASVLNCDVQDLPDVLGFSRASLFAYRAGKVNITEKAWRKLEAAERSASKGSETQKLYETRLGSQQGMPSAKVMESSDEDVVRRMERLELEVAELRAIVLKIRNAVNLRER